MVGMLQVKACCIVIWPLIMSELSHGHPEHPLLVAHLLPPDIAMPENTHGEELLGSASGCKSHRQSFNRKDVWHVIDRLLNTLPPPRCRSSIFQLRHFLSSCHALLIFRSAQYRTLDSGHAKESGPRQRADVCSEVITATARLSGLCQRRLTLLHDVSGLY